MSKILRPLFRGYGEYREAVAAFVTVPLALSQRVHRASMWTGHSNSLGGTKVPFHGQPQQCGLAGSLDSQWAGV